MAESSTRARGFLEQGLLQYGRGEVDAALVSWRQALELDPSNAEAQKLVRFVEERKSSGVVDARRTTRTMPVQREKTEMGLNPFLAAGQVLEEEDEDAEAHDRPTSDNLTTLGKDAAGEEEAPAGGKKRRKRHDTLVSALPALLAPSTRLSDRRTPDRAMHVPPGARPTPVPPTPYDPRALDRLAPAAAAEAAAAAAAAAEAEKGRATVPMAVQPAESGEYEDLESSELDQLIESDTVERTDPEGALAMEGLDFGTEPPTRPRADSVDPAPVEQASDEITRPIGDDGFKPQTPEPDLYNRSDTPIDMALAAARQKAAALVDECRAAMDSGNMAAAAVAADEALEEGERAPMPGIAEVIVPARSMFEQAFAGHLGPEDGVPLMSAEAAAVNTSNFDHRTGFLLSCIDGSLTIQTLIDISGMARSDCLRTLSRLLGQGIIKLG